MSSPPLPFGSRPAAALLVLWCVLVAAGTAAAQMVGGVHDFVDNGFTGGGICAACHIPHGAGDQARLYPRDMGLATTAPARLCMDCHDGTMPIGNGWPAIWAGKLPPDPGCHWADVVNENCTSCHGHGDAFSTGFGGCFSCHTNPPGAVGAADIDSQFDNIGFLDNALLLSQHNVEDSTVDCRKCHGPGHPADACLLVYADNIGTYTLGQVIPRSENMADYQDFCLACHDGVDVSTPPDPVPDTTFAGPLGTNQMGPSDRTNPATQQGGVPWLTPEVPPNPKANATTYFLGYEVDGHGAATSPIEAWPMNKTCLAQTVTPNTAPSSSNVLTGCHTAHGSQNRFLIADFDKAASPNVLYGPGIDQMSEMVLGVCLRADGCHSSTSLSDAVTNEPWRGAPRVQNEFHGAWMKNVNNTGPGHTRDNTGMAPWREYDLDRLEADASPNPVPRQFPNAEVLNAQILTSAAVDAGLLPFYADPGGANPVENRDYTPTLGARWYNAAGVWLGAQPAPNWISCLTCHDPHGTNSLLGEGMLRVDFSDMEIETDPLCGECHL